jgi:hypothetical protein
MTRGWLITAATVTNREKPDGNRNREYHTEAAGTKIYSVVIKSDEHRKQETYQETGDFKVKAKERYKIEAKNSKLKNVHGKDGAVGPPPPSSARGLFMLAGLKTGLFSVASLRSGVLTSYKFYVQWLCGNICFVIPERAGNHKIRTVTITGYGNIMHSALTKQHLNIGLVWLRIKIINKEYSQINLFLDHQGCYFCVAPKRTGMHAGDVGMNTFFFKCFSYKTARCPCTD